MILRLAIAMFLLAPAVCMLAQDNSTPAAPSSPAGQDSAIVGPGAYRVGGAVTAPKLLYSPDPEYSKEARKAHLQGTVVLWLIVDEKGLPQNIKVQRSVGMGLDEEAVKAVQRWRFRPSTKDGHPVRVMINVEVNFRL